MRIHYSLHRRAFTAEQERELATGIAVSYIEKGLFSRDADFKIDAINFSHKIETATPVGFTRRSRAARSTASAVRLKVKKAPPRQRMRTVHPR
jgi:hypothetical protein